MNCQLETVPRSYFFVDSLPGDPLRLGLAVYPDEKLVYWTDPAATLLQSTNASGPWTTNTAAACPIRIPESPAAEVLRLMK